MKKNNDKSTEFDFRTITSFEKACEKEGLDPVMVLPDVSMVPENLRKALIAVLKLFIIHQAINNGWIPRMGDASQMKYWAYHWVLSSGLGFDDSCYDYDDADATVGSRLCTFSNKSALFIAKTFTQEWLDFKLNIQG